MEVYKKIKDWPYEVSNLGNVKRLDWTQSLGKAGVAKPRGRLLKIRTETNGYCRVCLTRQNQKLHKSVHRLVAETFIPNPDNKPCINHKNGNKFDNRVENLEWVTWKENTAHWRNVLGVKRRNGETGRKCKQVLMLDRETKKLLKTFNGIGAAARATGILEVDISQCCLSKCKTAGGYAWRYKITKINQED